MLTLSKALVMSANIMNSGWPWSVHLELMKITSVVYLPTKWHWYSGSARSSSICSLLRRIRANIFSHTSGKASVVVTFTAVTLILVRSHKVPEAGQVSPHLMTAGGMWSVPGAFLFGRALIFCSTEGSIGLSSTAPRTGPLCQGRVDEGEGVHTEDVDWTNSSAETDGQKTLGVPQSSTLYIY